jgi:hypothetical protein
MPYIFQGSAIALQPDIITLQSSLSTTKLSGQALAGSVYSYGADTSGNEAFGPFVGARVTSIAMIGSSLCLPCPAGLVRNNGMRTL